jgi:hypothetical protein
MKVTLFEPCMLITIGWCLFFIVIKQPVILIGFLSGVFGALLLGLEYSKPTKKV